MRRVLIWILVIIPCLNVQGQDSLVRTTAANSLWLGKIARLDTDSKLRVLRDRLLKDTAVYVPDSFYVCNFVRKRGDPAWIVSKDTTGSRVIGAGKPLLIVEGLYINNGNSVRNGEILQLVSLLNPSYVESLELFDEKLVKAIFGDQAMMGVFVIKLKKSKYKALFKKFQFKQSYK